jgi:hypothetical protein
MVHIPWTQLSGRAFELPPRHVAFCLLLPNSFQKLFLTPAATADACSKHERPPPTDEAEHIARNLDNNNDGENQKEPWIFLQKWFPNVCSLSSSSSSSSFVMDPQHVKQQQQQQHVPWNIPLVLLAGDELWQHAKELGMLLCDDTRDDADGNHPWTIPPPQPRLWQPHPMIEYHVLPLLQTNVAILQQQAHQQQPPLLNQDGNHHDEPSYNNYNNNHHFVEVEIWDLGSGAGRDVCFLAESLTLQQQQQQLPSYHVMVCGIDHLLASAHRCLPFWKRRRVDSHTCSLLLDLHQVSQVEQVWKKRTETISHHYRRRLGEKEDIDSGGTRRQSQRRKKIMCCYAVRFYHRPLIEWILQYLLSSSQEAIHNRNNPNNDHEEQHDLSYTIPFVLAVSHFCKPTPQATWTFDHPKVVHKNRWLLL